MSSFKSANSGSLEWLELTLTIVLLCRVVSGFVRTYTDIDSSFGSIIIIEIV